MNLLSTVCRDGTSVFTLVAMMTAFLLIRSATTCAFVHRTRIIRHGLRRQHQRSRHVIESSSSICDLKLPKHDQPIHTIAAPMVAASDFAFRCLCRQYGVDLTFTQMLHTENLLKQETFRKNHLDLWEYTGRPTKWTREQLEFLDGCHSKIDFDEHQVDGSTTGPVIVQLAGHDPSRVVEAAKLILDHTYGQVHGFDLNLGCPQGIARKGRYGAFLMEHDPSVACAILSALRQSLPESVSVSAKIRLPVDTNKLSDRVLSLLDTGIDFLTVHGRTIHENKVAVKACHFDEIAKAVELAHGRDASYPIVANGGIEQFSDVGRVRELTGTAAVMSSEALLENPGLFALDSSSWTPRQRLDLQFRYAFEYLGWCHKYPPLPGVLGQSCNIVRSHLFKILFRYLSEQPDLRDKLATHGVRRLIEFEHVCRELNMRYASIPDEKLENYPSSHVSSSWYRRHREIKSNISSPFESQSTGQRKVAARQRIAKLRKEREERNAIRQYAQAYAPPTAANYEPL